jgi:hypothetical protein
MRSRFGAWIANSRKGERHWIVDCLSERRAKQYHQDKPRSNERDESPLNKKSRILWSALYAIRTSQTAANQGIEFNKSVTDGRCAANSNGEADGWTDNE